MPRVVAKKLGIHLSSRKEGELFKWFLACLLFGKLIQQEIAERAYARLVSAGLRKPDAVLGAGWGQQCAVRSPPTLLEIGILRQQPMRVPSLHAKSS
jgi:hypothetical protein